MNFLGPPRDWIERFGRHFIVHRAHPSGRQQRERNPALAEDSPPSWTRRRSTPTSSPPFGCATSARSRKPSVFSAKACSPTRTATKSCFELGRLCYENNHDAARARKIWELALRRWSEQEAANKKPDLLKLDQIAVNLSRLEEQEGNLARAIQLLELAQKGSPHPEALQKQIDDLKQKLAAQPRSAAPAAR